MSFDRKKTPPLHCGDGEILLHRNCHFEGNFASMLTYYRAEGRGAQMEFSIQRLEKLMRIEEKLRLDLSDLLLNEEQKMRQQRALDSHQFFANLAKSSNSTNVQRAIAELILSRNEEPTDHLRRVEKFGQPAVVHLIKILRSSQLYNSLYPGFGLAPELAAKCLGLISDPQAIPHLFGKIGEVGFFMEDVVLEALKKIGNASRDFLLQKLQAHPFSEENQKAAFALVHFRGDFEVAAAGFRLLTDEHTKDRSCFMNSLVMICEGLAGTSLAGPFCQLQDDDTFPQLTRQDVRDVVQNWKG